MNISSRKHQTNQSQDRAASIFITQCCHPRYNPHGLDYSENCGPTSLAMAARLLGTEVPSIPGLPDPQCAQGLIDAVRFWMFSTPCGRSVDEKKDGVEFTPSGVRRAPEEHLALINLPDLERGASNLGLNPKRLWSWSEIDSSLASNLPVALAGDPSLAGAYGPRLNLDYKGGHIVLLLDCCGTRYLVNDPLLECGPCWLDPPELQAFVSSAPFAPVLALALEKNC